MTRHNLGEHLPWLLSSFARFPPSGPQLPAASASDERDNASSSIFSLNSHSLPLPTTRPISLSQPPTANEGQFPPRHPEAAANEVVMMEEGTTKFSLDNLVSKPPSLATKQLPLPTPTSTTATTPIGPLQRAYSASLARDSNFATPHPSKKKVTPLPSRPDTWAPSSPARPPELQLDNLEELCSDPLDLTEADTHDGSSSVLAFGEDRRLWHEDFAERPEPVSSRRSKPRSEASYERLGVLKGKTEGEVGTDRDEFPDIDDLIHPSSAHKWTPSHHSLASSMNHSHKAIGLARAITTPAAHSDISSSHRKRKTSPPPSFQDADSVQIEPPAVESKTISRTKRLRRSDVVSDSEDEFMSPLTHQSVLEAEVSPSPSSRVRHQAPNQDDGMDVEMPCPPLEMPPPKSAAAAHSGDPPLSSESKDRTFFSCANSTNGAPSDQAQPSQETNPPKNLHPSSGSEPARDQHLLTLFLKRPSVLDNKLLLVDDQLRRNKDEFKKCLDENAPKEERERVKNARGPLLKTQKALKTCMAEYHSYKELSDKREALVASLTDAFDNGLDTAEDEARLDQLAEQIKTKEAELIGHLAAAGVDDLDFLKDPNDSIAAPDSPAAPVVFATQPSLKALSKEKANTIPEYHSQSQVIAQTQLPPAESHTSTVSTPTVRSVTFHTVSGVPRPIASETLRRVRPDIAAGNSYRETSEDSLFIDNNSYAPVTLDDSLALSQSKTPMSRSKGPAKAGGIRDYFEDISDDDEAMLAAVNHLEQRTSTAALSRDGHRVRSALSEASGNAGPPRRTRPAAKNVPSLQPKASWPADQMKYPWSPDVRRALKDRFRMTEFRPNQLEAINATLAGKDAFVLMPTGGGKSLCYQLPAVINTGRTRGITIVISPLLSLMNDQVEHLEKLNIRAASFNSQSNVPARNAVLEAFNEDNPEFFLQLLYVTPEMVVKSVPFQEGLKKLHRKKKLARIVIDEAHCVSHWGHDFRPDYQQIGKLRQRFPGVPVMALTATATGNVIADVKHNLDMDDCEVFSQSFDRPNLYYEVVKRPATFVAGMAELIKTKYPGQSGIIYTLSRKSAEATAESLVKKHDIKACHYHAQVDVETRAKVQRQWQRGEIQVVVATIAFGMGIDKPNVRFVIHQHMPKNLEGYYQETGRAGRDGEPAGCYLYYAYTDLSSLRRMINEDREYAKVPEQKERLHALLNQMVSYCERRECRRVQLLRYFGENIDASQCNKNCDNCKNGERNSEVEVQDFTDTAKAILIAVRSTQPVTLGKLVEILIGRNRSKYEGAEGFGLCKGMKNYEIQRIAMALHGEGALRDQYVVDKGKVPLTEFWTGPLARQYLEGRRRLRLEVPKGGRAPNQVKNNGRLAATDDEGSDSYSAPRRKAPPSTNVSSPVAALSKKRKHKSAHSTFVDEDDEDADHGSDRELHGNGYEKDDFVVSDEEEKEEEDAFEPAPSHRRPQPSRQRQQTLDELGPPISRDNRLDEAGLDEVHQDIVRAFVEEATELGEAVRNRYNLRRALFTEQQYREMAIRWTTSVPKMYTIRGIDRTKVDLYGAEFASLVRRFNSQYLEMMGKIDYSAAVMVTNKKREVIDLTSDDEDELPRNRGRRGTEGLRASQDEGEEEDEDMEEDEEEEEEELEFSRYFGDETTKAPSPTESEASHVREWHRRYKELSRPSPRKSAASSRAAQTAKTKAMPKYSGWKGSKKSNYSKAKGAGSGAARGGSSFGRGGSSAGVSKRSGSFGSRQNGGSTSAPSRPRSKTGSKRHSSGSGIPLMPH